MKRLQFALHCSLLVSCAVALQQDPSVSHRDLELQPCPDAQVPFLTITEIAYRAGCSFVDDDLPLLEKAFLDTYNALFESDYCDPFQIQVEEVSSFFETDRSTDSKLSIDFFADGTCVGCDPTTLRLFLDEEDIRMEDFISDMEGLLSGVCQEADPSDLVCTETRRINRRPSKQEFLESYSVAIQELSEDLVCVTSLFGVDLPTEAPTLAPTIQTNCTISLQTPVTSTVVLVLQSKSGCDRTSSAKYHSSIQCAY